MEAVCIMKGIKPERKPDPSGSGRMVEDFWGPSQKMLGDLKFLESLKVYDKDNIPAAIIKKIREKWVVKMRYYPSRTRNRRKGRLHIAYAIHWRNFTRQICFSDVAFQPVR